MTPLYTFDSPPGRCSYLPGRAASFRNEVVRTLTPAEYQERLLAGWRRFGHLLFRPVCPSCRACQSLRVPVATFRPDRSQRRAAVANADLTLSIGEPAVTDEKLDLYDKFHAAQAERVGWDDHGPKDPAEYAESFTVNPLPVEEWQYRLGGRLVGVGYVDVVPAGLSAVYFFHDPDEHKRSLGTFNVLSVIRAAADRGLPHVYLGYYVDGYRSLAYKARFRPHELLAGDGLWSPGMTNDPPMTHQ
ncbi:MAG: arginyltransferase [Gemmataceae bacterium]|nr:arginyltransferase [Gemmataceae bacterium]